MVTGGENERPVYMQKKSLRRPDGTKIVLPERQQRRPQRTKTRASSIYHHGRTGPPGTYQVSRLVRRSGGPLRQMLVGQTAYPVK